MNNLIERIRADLKTKADPKTQLSAQNFFKEKIVTYGVKTPTVGKIAHKFWPEIKSQEKQQIFALCEQLFRSGYIEETFIVASWLPNMIDRLEPIDLIVFKKWIEQYFTNWATCDAFCNHSVGDLLEKYPQTIIELLTWAKSECRWLRRASAVSIILPARKGEFLKEIFEICNILLNDDDDLVQKGYGWLLKEASKKHQDEVFRYILKNKVIMPRTALRYAIELMPKELKIEAMKKD